MRIVVAAVGRLKAGAERELAERYRDRADKTGRALGIRDIEVIEVRDSRAREPERRILEESIAVASVIPDGAITVTLDGRANRHSRGQQHCIAATQHYADSRPGNTRRSRRSRRTSDSTRRLDAERDAVHIRRPWRGHHRRSDDALALGQSGLVFDQVPAVAIKILEHGHRSIGFVARLFDEFHATRKKGGVVADEILGVKTEENAPHGLGAHLCRLSRGFSPRQPPP